MQNRTNKLLTIITESVLETTLARELDRLNARGYTITDARGKGHHGVRNAGWEPSSNIRIEVACDEATAGAIAGFLEKNYSDNYAMILFTSDIEVLRLNRPPSTAT